MCGAVRPGVAFASRFTIARLLHKEVMTPLIILTHFALSVTEDSVMMWSNKFVHAPNGYLTSDHVFHDQNTSTAFDARRQ